MNGDLRLKQLAVVFHPGETLDEKLKEMGMSVKEFAVRTSKPVKTIIAIKNGNSSITSEMAVSFENATKIPANFWLTKQRMYDEYVVRVKREQDAVLSADWMKKFPVAEMEARGWIPKSGTVSQKVMVLYNFFGISSQKAWEDYYINKELKVAFSISLLQTKNPYAISAWLRQGELTAAEMPIEASYNEKKLRTSLIAMMGIMTEGGANYFDKLQAICASVGIKLIRVACLKKAPLNGATRWLNDTPIIQMSDQYKDDEAFWFTFFHEVGHILLHGKKAIFLEEGLVTDGNEEKEGAANAFAREVLQRNVG